MAFIKTTTNKEGRTHVYLVEGYRKDGKVRQRILKKYGWMVLDNLIEDKVLETAISEGFFSTICQASPGFKEKIN